MAINWDNLTWEQWNTLTWEQWGEFEFTAEPEEPGEPSEFVYNAAYVSGLGFGMGF